jgi:hypothetical protein
MRVQACADLNDDQANGAILNPMMIPVTNTASQINSITSVTTIDMLYTLPFRFLCAMKINVPT